MFLLNVGPIGPGLLSTWTINGAGNGFCSQSQGSMGRPTVSAEGALSRYGYEVKLSSLVMEGYRLQSTAVAESCRFRETCLH